VPVDETEQLGGRRPVQEGIAVLDTAVDARRDPQLQVRIERGVPHGSARGRADLAVHLGHGGGKGGALFVTAEDGDHHVAEGRAAPLDRVLVEVPAVDLALGDTAPDGELRELHNDVGAGERDRRGREQVVQLLGHLAVRAEVRDRAGGGVDRSVRGGADGRASGG